MASTTNDVEAFHRFQRAHENRVRSILNIRYDIELVVHAINEIDVRRAARAVHRFRAIGAPAGVRVRRAIFGAAIGFGLNDDSGDARAVSVWDDKFLAEQIPGNFEDVRTCVEFARKLFIHRLRRWSQYRVLTFPV